MGRKIACNRVTNSVADFLHSNLSGFWKEWALNHNDHGSKHVQQEWRRKNCYNAETVWMQLKANKGYDILMNHDLM